MSKQDDFGIVSSGFSYRATGFRCCLNPLQNHIALSVKYGINLPLYLVEPPGQEVAARIAIKSGAARIVTAAGHHLAGTEVHCQQFDHPRLVPGPSGSMMASGRLRPVAIALIFLLDPPENGQRRDMSAALSGRGRPMPHPFCPSSAADAPGQANCRSIAGNRLASPPALRTPAARIRTGSTIEAIADRRRGAITLQQVPLGRAGTAPGNSRSAGHPHVRRMLSRIGQAL